MGASAGEADRLRRFLRFLRLTAGGWVPDETGRVLLEREAVRRTASRITGVCAAAAGVLVFAAGNLALARATLVLVAFVVLIVGLLARQIVINAGERRSRRTVSGRLTHSASVPIRTRFGTSVLVGTVALLVLDVALAVVLFVRVAPGRAWLFALLLAVGLASTTWLLRAVLTRPVLAVDALTLAADDRLRTHDCGCACYPLFGLYMAGVVLAEPGLPLGVGDVLLMGSIMFSAMLTRGVLSRFEGGARWVRQQRSLDRPAS